MSTIKRNSPGENEYEAEQSETTGSTIGHIGQWVSEVISMRLIEVREMSTQSSTPVSSYVALGKLVFQVQFPQL